MLFSLAVLRRSSRAAVVVSSMTSTRRRLKTRTYFLLQLLHLSPLRRRPQVAELAHSAGSSTHTALRRLSIAAQLSTTTFLTSCAWALSRSPLGLRWTWWSRSIVVSRLPWLRIHNQTRECDKRRTEEE
jgi:hypothetical protein